MARKMRDPSAQRAPGAARPVLEALEPRLLLSADCPVITRIDADNRGEVALTSSRDLSPATVTSTSVRLLTAGPDGLLGTTDDAPVAATVNYENASRRIVLRATVPANTRYVVQLDASTIRGANNVFLDGEFNGPGLPTGNGTPGGDLIFFTKRPVSLVARLTTTAGTIDIDLLRDQTPQTVANFLSYADRGIYDTTFFHRLVDDFVIQAGGFRTPALDLIPTDPPVVNEPGVTNARGTIAMAKLPGDPNSATSQFFFNLIDNRGVPPNGLDFQNGGFTAFARVRDAAGLAVMDQLAQFMTFNASSQSSAFNEIPVRNLASVQARGRVEQGDVIAITRVALLMDLDAQPSAQLPTTGSMVIPPPPGMASTASVQIFDTDQMGGVGTPGFATVVYGAGNMISSITLRDPGPPGPIGIRITGAPFVGAINDLRTSPGRAISYIISDGRVGSIRINCPIVGANLNGFVLPGGEILDEDIDGDGDAGDSLAILVKQGLMTQLHVRGDLTGDVISRGGIGSVIVNGDVRDADFNLGTGTLGFAGTTFALNAVDSSSITSPVPIASIRAMDWSNSFGKFNTIRAPSIGSISITGDARRGLPGDFWASLNLSGATAGRQTLPSAIITGRIQKALWQIAGTVGTVSANAGFENWSLRGTADVQVVRSTGNLDGVTIDTPGRITLLMGARFMGGVVRADSVAQFLVLGNPRLSEPGDLSGEITLTRNAATPTLGTMVVNGSVLSSVLNISGLSPSIVIRGAVSDTTIAQAREINSLQILGPVERTQVTASTRINSLSAPRWDGGRITAPTITRINITGDARNRLPGDLRADITATTELSTLFTGMGGSLQSTLTTRRSSSIIVGGDLINSIITFTIGFQRANNAIDDFRVMGTVDHSDIRARTNMGRVSFGGMHSSILFLSAPASLVVMPDAPTGFNPDATLRNFSITRAGQGPHMIDSIVAAGRIESATVHFPDINNNGRPFGFAANTIGRVVAAIAGRPALGVVGTSPSQDVGDFQVRPGMVPPPTP